MYTNLQMGSSLFCRTESNQAAPSLPARGPCNGCEPCNFLWSFPNDHWKGCLAWRTAHGRATWLFKNSNLQIDRKI